MPDVSGRKRRFLPLLMASASLGLPGAAWAQASATQGDTTILVTGRALPETPATPAYDVDTIDRAALSSAPSGRIEDALASVAGFQQFRRSDSRSSNPSAQGVTLRALGGNAASRTLVLLDGVPMVDPFFGYVPLSAIAPERLASARVTRGGGSGAFGAGAVSGIIDLASANADELGLVNASILSDDSGDTALSGSIAPKLGSKGFAVLSGSWDRGDGFWTTPLNQRVPASVRARYDSWSLSARAVLALSHDIELQARGLAYDDNRTLRFAGADSGSQGQDFSLRLVGRGPWQFDALAYVQGRDFNSITISSTSYRKVLNEYATPSTGIGGKLELRPPLGRNQALRLGSDWRIGTGSEAEDAYSGSTGLLTAHHYTGGSNSDVGLFLDDDWTLGALVLTGGARADHWAIRDGYFQQRNPAGALTINTAYPDRAGWVGSFRGGALLKLGGGVALRATGYSNFRQPTLNELYRPFTVFPVTTQANAALKNELLHGMEAGLDYTPVKGVTLTFTAFDDRLKNAITNVPITAILQQRMNVDAIRARGLEFGAKLALGRFSLDGSLALTDAKVEASGLAAAINGLRPAQTPRLAASATLGWHPRPRYEAALTLRRVGAQFEDTQASSTLPGATTLGAFAQLPLAGPVTLVLRGENLTNARVETRDQIVGSAHSIDLGAPRTLWAGVRVALSR